MEVSWLTTYDPGGAAVVRGAVNLQLTGQRKVQCAASVTFVPGGIIVSPFAKSKEPSSVADLLEPSPSGRLTFYHYHEIESLEVAALTLR